MTKTTRIKDPTKDLLSAYLDCKLKDGRSVAETFLTGFSAPEVTELLLSLVERTGHSDKSAPEVLLEGETALRMALHSFAYCRQGFSAFVEHRREMAE
jgi:hypothetical protein